LRICMSRFALVAPLLVQLHAAEDFVPREETTVEAPSLRHVHEHSNGSTCKVDAECGLQRPICIQSRCQDLYDFNASVGECICERPNGCGREEIGRCLENSSISDCAKLCKENPDCQGFEGFYRQTGAFACTLMRTLPRQNGEPGMLTGDGRRGSQHDVFCYNKPMTDSQCHRHVACLATAGHFCCPDRRGAMLGCCLSPSTYEAVGLFGSFCTAILALMLACSLFFNCRSWGKPSIATPANDVPGSSDISFPNEIRGHRISLGEYNELQDHMATAGRFLIAFVNPGSGDQSGKRFEKLFEALLAKNGKICKLPADLDSGLSLAAKLLRQNSDVVVLACGGDGTVTWVLSELNERRDTIFKDVRLPPVGIIPLGTGNDLARSLGWGPALTDNFQLLSYVQRALEAEMVSLDQWQLTLRPTHLLPPSLRQRGTVEFVGYFTNYFSVGMDAHTAYEVGRVRSSPLGKCCFRTRCCSPCRFIHGGLLCYALNGPNCARCLCCRTRALNDDLEVRFDDDPGTIVFPSSIRQFTLTNLNSYGAGMQLYGADAMGARVSPNDGRLEVFTRQGPYAVIGMTLAKKVLKTPCGNVDIAFQPRKVEMHLKKGQHFQMDGEPWLLNAACTATIERHTKVRMLCPREDGRGAGVWSGCQKRDFWYARQASGSIFSTGEQELCTPLPSRESRTNVA